MSLLRSIIVNYIKILLINTVQAIKFFLNKIFKRISIQNINIKRITVTFQSLSAIWLKKVLYNLISAQPNKTF